MPSFFSNPFGNRSAEILPTVEPNRQNDQRRLSTVSMDEALDWHETFMFGANDEPTRLRRASSFGDVSAYATMVASEQEEAGEGETQRLPQQRPEAFRYRSPSVIEARQQGLGRTRQRQASIVQDRRTSVSGRRTSVCDRRGSVQNGRRASMTLEARTRQPSVAWARQSSIIDRQLANMTWSQAERLMSLDDQFYRDAGDATAGQKTLLADKLKRLEEKQAKANTDEVAYPDIADPKDPAKVLGQANLRYQKLIFMLFIFALNAGCMFGAVFGGGPAGTFVFVFILWTKSKDTVSVVLGMLYMPLHALYRYFWPAPPVTGHWILTLIPAYSESEETIVKAIRSLRDNNVAPHEQVMVVILDGKARDVKAHMRIVKSFRRPYVTFKWKRGELLIDAGFVDEVPVIVFEKVKNAGKKDSLILAFDLFNALRDNAPLYTKLLREEIWRKILPVLTAGKSVPFEKFDMVFCTDADSTIYKGALLGLANALIRDPKAIAACGSVLVDTQDGEHYSFWNLYQQFQYSFGQFVRRRGEHIWGKVTCLPGCITMIRVRDEMKGAITKYAEPITKTPVIHHQVQYLGTDRRLTYSMLSQSPKLHTLFVPDAVSLTEAPQSLRHYLSQRRRWGSNSYFNDWFYLFGENMILITRLEAAIEITRLSLVYYRIANTIMFFYGLTTRSFGVMQLVPLLIVSQLPTLWFLINIIIVKELRRRAHKIFLGFLINHLLSPFMSMTIFFNVLRNLGSQVWGMTGGNNATAAAAAAAPAVAPTASEIIAPIKASIQPLAPALITATLNTTEKSAERVHITKEDAPHVTHGSISGSSDGKGPLATVAEMEESEDESGPTSKFHETTEAKPRVNFQTPLGMNVAFSFGTANKENDPFRDPPQTRNPFASPTFDGFGGFGASSSLGSSSPSGRRRSSAAGPLDRRRQSSVVNPFSVNEGSDSELFKNPSSIMLGSLPPRKRQGSVAVVPRLDEEPEPDSPLHHVSFASTTAHLNSRRASSSASKASRDKGSIVSLPIAETDEEEDEVCELQIEKLAMPSSPPRRVSIATTLGPVPRNTSANPVGRRASMAPIKSTKFLSMDEGLNTVNDISATSGSLSRGSCIPTSVGLETSSGASAIARRDSASTTSSRPIPSIDDASISIDERSLIPECSPRQVSIDTTLDFETSPGATSAARRASVSPTVWKRIPSIDEALDPISEEPLGIAVVSRHLSVLTSTNSENSSGAGLTTIKDSGSPSVSRRISSIDNTLESDADGLSKVALEDVPMLASSPTARRDSLSTAFSKWSPIWHKRPSVTGFDEPTAESSPPQRRPSIFAAAEHSIDVPASLSGQRTPVSPVTPIRHVTWNTSTVSVVADQCGMSISTAVETESSDTSLPETMRRGSVSPVTRRKSSGWSVGNSVHSDDGGLQTIREFA